MGTVWIDSVQIGTFTPDIEGTTGDVYIDAVDIGDFTLNANGFVYLGAVQIGTYVAAGAPAPPSTFEDARYRTKVYLDTYLLSSNLLNDISEPVTYAVIYANPNYPLSKEFRASSDEVDLLFLIGKPTSELMYGVRYTEHVPITVCTIDKTNLTGTKLTWTAEKELRRIAETYPHGSLRSVERISDSEIQLGSTVLYSTTFMLNYRRTALEAMS